MQLKEKLELIEQLPASGYFTPLSIRILVELAFSFSDLSYENFVEILKGAHVVIRNDQTDFWFKWKEMSENEGACVKTLNSYGSRDKKKEIFKKLNKVKCKYLKSSRPSSENIEWKNYIEDRVSSHPSVPVYTKTNRKIGKELKVKFVGNNVDQYEIKLGYNSKDSIFCMLIGSYEFRGEDNIPTKDHSGVMADPKEYNFEEHPLKDDREYKSTWFQFEQYSADGTLPEKALHLVDWADYKWNGLNIGPFGKSNYTEKPWKPLFVNFDPTITKSDLKYLKTKFRDISQISIESISNKFIQNMCFNNTSYKDLYTNIISKKGCEPFRFSFDEDNNFSIKEIRPKSKKSTKHKLIDFYVPDASSGRTVVQRKPQLSLNTIPVNSLRRSLKRSTSVFGGKKKKVNKKKESKYKKRKFRK